MATKTWVERVKAFRDATGSGKDWIHRKYFEQVVDTEEVTTWDELLTLLTSRFSDRQPWVFRGHSGHSWRLETSLERAILRNVVPGTDKREIEHYVTEHPNDCEDNLLYQFQRKAHHYIATPPADHELLEWFALMQHHGVPTRLLDWTYSPYVALYFALETLTHEKCAVWAIDTKWLFDEAKRCTKKQNIQFPDTIDDRAFSRYVNDVLSKGIGPSIVVAVNPIRMNERLAAQGGTFLCDLGKRETFDLTLLRMIDSTLAEPDSLDVALLLAHQKPNAPICKIIINTKERTCFMYELDKMNIHAASLFPGLDGFGRYIRCRLENTVNENYEAMGWPVIRSTCCR